MATNPYDPNVGANPYVIDPGAKDFAAQNYAALTRDLWAQWTTNFLPYENKLIEYSSDPGVVDEAQAGEAQRAIHAAFQLGKVGGGSVAPRDRLDLILLGFGRIGRSLGELVAELMGRFKTATHEALHGVDRVLRVRHSLPLRHLANQPLATLRYRHNRRRRPRTLSVRDNDRLPAFHHSHAAVRRPQVNSNYLSHIVPFVSCWPLAVSRQ